MRHALCSGSWQNSKGNTKDFLGFATLSKTGIVYMEQAKIVNGDIQRFTFDKIM